MPVGLSPEEMRGLLALFPTFNDAALVAIEKPRYGEELKAQGARIVEANGEPHVWFSPDREELCWKLVVAAHLEADDEQREPLIGEPDLAGKPLPKLPVMRALKAFAERTHSIRGVEQHAPFSSYTLANRVWTWHRSGAVRWNVSTKKFDLDPRFELVSPSEDTFRLIRR